MSSDTEDLAAQAGLIPGISAPVTSPEETPAVDTPNAAPQAPISGPITNPGLLPPGGKVGQGFGVENKAFSPQAFSNITKSTDPEINKIDQRVNQEAQSEFEPINAMWQEVRKHGYEAQDQETAAKKAKIDAAGRESQHMAEIQGSWAKEESRINAEYSAQANQAKSAYLTAIADLRASRVDPSQLWGSMSKGDQFGTLASVFVHDFLGAGPAHIKTSAMDTINKAIDRNIDSQLEQIKIKGEVAQGFKSLWEMQRAQAASDTEARLRVRGIMLDQMKSQVSANMAKYDSGLATAEGQQALAAIDKESATNLTKVYEAIDNNKMAMRGQEMHLLGVKAQTAVEYAKIKAQQDASRAAAMQAAKDALIPDPTPSGGGRARWAFRLDMSKDDKKRDEILDKVGGLAAFDQQAREFQELARKVGSLPTTKMADQVLTSDQRRLLELADKMAYSRTVAISGKSFNEKELELNRKLFNIDTWSTRGSTDTEIAQTIKDAHNEAFGAMSPYVKELQPDDLGYGVQIGPAFNATNTDTPNASPGVGVSKEQDAIIRGRQPTLVDKAQQMITSSPGQAKAAPGVETPASSNKAAAPDLISDLEKAGVDARAEWDKYHKDALNRALKDVDSNPYYDKKHGAIEITREDAKAQITKQLENFQGSALPDWAAGLEALKVAAIKGDDQAIKLLSSYANPTAIADPEGMSPGNPISKKKQEFAKYEWDQLLQYLDRDKVKAAGGDVGGEYEDYVGGPSTQTQKIEPPPKPKRR